MRSRSVGKNRSLRDARQRGPVRQAHDEPDDAERDVERRERTLTDPGEDERVHADLAEATAHLDRGERACHERHQPALPRADGDEASQRTHRWSRRLASEQVAVGRRRHRGRRLGSGPAPSVA